MLVRKYLNKRRKNGLKKSNIQCNFLFYNETFITTLSVEQNKSRIFNFILQCTRTVVNVRKMYFILGNPMFLFSTPTPPLIALE
jgi:hypothetical protein